MANIFKKHPNSVGETYIQHFLKASGFGFKLLKIAFQAFTHAVFPWFFENSASDQIQELNRVLQERRDSANSDKN